MKRIGCVISALALALLETGPSLAQSPGSSAGTGESVTIPFAPKLGETIRLHSERTHSTDRAAGEALKETITSDDQLVFTEKNATGYLLRWTTGAVSVRTSPQRQAVMQAIAGASVGKTAIIQTDPHGFPLTLVNAAEMRSLLSAALDGAVNAAVAGQPADEQQRMRKALTGLAGMYRGMSDPQMTNLMLEDARLLLGAGGTRIARDQPLPYSDTVALPVGNFPLKVSGQVVLKDLSPTSLTIETTSTADPKDVELAVKKLLGNALANVSADRQAPLLAATEQLKDFKVSTDFVATLDRQTGIPVRAHYIKVASVEDQTQQDEQSYTRMP